MRFLFDTNTVSYALRGYGQVNEQILEHRPSEIGVSAITVAELRFGAHKRGSRKLHRLLDAFLAPVVEVPFDSRAADRYGKLAAELQSRGETLEMADAMIAAHALELGVILVTHNVRHFDRVDGLEITDWV
ncbi:MAG: type II toxin-antitoxin system VapC family toxin [bacterium]|nr:type II toxin-antitoxin system VapC family toxin [bacterium]